MRHAVVAVILRGPRMLLIQRAEGLLFAGYWTPLSGRIEPGESQAEAVVREVREEVGLDVIAIRKVWECPTEGADFLLHWWLVEERDPGASTRPDPAEVAAARWCTPAEIHALDPTFEADLDFVDRILPEIRDAAEATSASHHEAG